MRWTTTVLASEDPASVMMFWAALLGGEPVPVTDDFVVLQHGSGWLAAQRSADVTTPTWPRGEHPVQIHLDIAVTDLDAAVNRALELGATEDPEQPNADGWRVMRAPGGHLFCLSHRIQDYLPITLD